MMEENTRVILRRVGKNKWEAELRSNVEEPIITVVDKKIMKRVFQNWWKTYLGKLMRKQRSKK